MKWLQPIHRGMRKFVSACLLSLLLLGLIGNFLPSNIVYAKETITTHVYVDNYEDDFERSNSDTVGNDWREYNNSATDEKILDGNLVFNRTADDVGAYKLIEGTKNVTVIFQAKVENDTQFCVAGVRMQGSMGVAICWQFFIGMASTDNARMKVATYWQTEYAVDQDQMQTYKIVWSDDNVVWYYNGVLKGNHTSAHLDHFADKIRLHMWTAGVSEIEYINIYSSPSAINVFTGDELIIEPQGTNLTESYTYSVTSSVGTWADNQLTWTPTINEHGSYQITFYAESLSEIETKTVQLNVFPNLYDELMVKSENNPILKSGDAEDWDRSYIRDPVVIELTNGTFLMYYSGSNSTLVANRLVHIGVASSNDGGFTWTKQGVAFYASNGTANWDNKGVGIGSVFKLSNGTWLMYYSGCNKTNGEGVGIGLATSDDLSTWTRYAGNPIVLPTDIFATAGVATASLSLAWVMDWKNGTYSMTCEGSSITPFVGKSTDLVTWSDWLLLMRVELCTTAWTKHGNVRSYYFDDDMFLLGWNPAHDGDYELACGFSSEMICAKFPRFDTSAIERTESWESVRIETFGLVQNETGDILLRSHPDNDQYSYRLYYFGSSIGYYFNIGMLTYHFKAYFDTDKYVQVQTPSEAILHDVSYESDELSFWVLGKSGVTSTTKVYCGSKGEPKKVTGATSHSYDEAIGIETITVDHSSSQEVELDWSDTKAVSALKGVYAIIYAAVPLLGMIAIVLIAGGVIYAFKLTREMEWS